MDINCDLGEGAGNDEKIMPYITSCNIACGGHAGDELTVARTLRLAKKYSVKAGAHPSFPDRENFGRKLIKIDKKELEKALLSQIFMIGKIAKKEGVKLHHLKLHGALYNQAAKDKGLAMLILNIMKKLDKSLILYVPYNSLIADLSQQYKIPYFYEVFADRAYHEDLSLVSRGEPGALIYDPDVILKRVKLIKDKAKVVTVSGKEVRIKGDTVCVHGDHPNAVAIARKLKEII